MGWWTDRGPIFGHNGREATGVYAIILLGVLYAVLPAGLYMAGVLETSEAMIIMYEVEAAPFVVYALHRFIRMMD